MSTVSIVNDFLVWIDRVAALKNIPLIAEETDCLAGYIRKGISMACFFYARCLAMGLGIKQDMVLAREFYSWVSSATLTLTHVPLYVLFYFYFINHNGEKNEHK
jgi:hypothetical protein